MTHTPRLRHAVVILLALGAACLLILLTARGASGQPGEGAVDEDPSGAPYVAGELIVTYEESIPEAPVERVTEEVESAVQKSLPAVDAQLISFPEAKEEGSREEREQILEEKKEELEGDPAVRSVDYNYLKELEAIPNDPLFDRQWHLGRAGRVAAPVAWNTTTGDGAAIAVIDSGIDLDHPDLRDKISDSINTSGDSGNADDTNGHGTHVAGIAAAATNNNRGVAGTCPDCSLLAARAQSRSGEITDAAVIAAINWATVNRADVINMSYSSPSQSDAERNALNAASSAGITLVAAAGKIIMGTPAGTRRRTPTS
ncbi:MAG: S8 family serine peptidase [Rubrobacter sp.]|nr:S8 family serine peptidase [Rubrobacter sp.]